MGWGAKTKMYDAVLKAFYKFSTIVSIIGVVLAGIIIYAYSHVKASIPNSDFLKDYQAPEITRVYDKHFKLVQEFSAVKRLNLKIDRIPDIIISAFLVAEDKNFYYHPGIDPLRILRAALQNIFQNKSQQYLVGASTITQQVAKNFLVGSEKSFLRKFREAFATIAIEHQLTKDRILELYLNQIYLGNGAYGVQAASLKYFGKSIEQVTVAEACLLASLPKAPGKLSIARNLKRLKERRNSVINGLLEQGYIPQKIALEAMESPIKFSSQEKPETNYGYYVNPLRDAISRDVPQLNMTSGLEIFSCMDTRFQQAAQKALRDGLLNYDLKQKIFYRPIARLGSNYSIYSLKNVVVHDCPANFQKAVVDIDRGKMIAVLENKKSYTLDLVDWTLQTPLTKGDVILVQVKGNVAKIRQIPEVTGAIVVMEASTGQVLAVSGGWSSVGDPFNCATQAMRQPGSCFKPFVYLAALEHGAEPTDIIEDEPITMHLNNGREIYKPKNITGKIYGPVTVKNSLAYSYNLASLNLGLSIGLEHVQDTAELFQVYENAPKHPSIILGSRETTLLKLTTAYATIFNGGYRIKPKFYHSFTQRKTSCLSKNMGTLCFEGSQDMKMIPVSTVSDLQRLASPIAIFGLKEMLRAVITHGTGRSLQPLESKFGVTIRGKTGTSNNNRDAWFIGSVSIPGTIYQDANPLVIGVFVGFLKPKNLGDGNGGGVVAIPIFGNFIKNIVSDILW